MCAVYQYAKRSGWRSWAGWTDEGLLLRLQDHDLETARKILDNILKAIALPGVDLSNIERSVPVTPLPDTTNGPIAWGSVVDQDLTLKFLLRLPNSGFIFSHILKRNGRPALAMPLGSIEARRTLWNTAKEVGVAGRMSTIIWFEEDFQAVAAGLLTRMMMSEPDPSFMDMLMRELAEHRRA